MPSIRITCTPPGGGAPTIVRIEGQLADTAVAELANVTDACFARGERIRVDLSGVSFADRAGADLLRRLLDRGTVLEGASNFVHGAIYGD